MLDSSTSLCTYRLLGRKKRNRPSPQALISLKAPRLLFFFRLAEYRFRAVIIVREGVRRQYSQFVSTKRNIL